jgi:hypothetical protein
MKILIKKHFFFLMRKDYVKNVVYSDNRYRAVYWESLFPSNK